MMATTNYNLPTITGNMTADVPRDMNALAEATDDAIKSVSEQAGGSLAQHALELPTKTKLGHVRLQEDYISGALQNGWQGSFLFAKNDLGIVSLKLNSYGMVTTGGTVIATLPHGYRPKAATIFPITTDINGGIKFLIIGEGSGEIIIPVDSMLEANRVYLAGATFYAGE
ncbi:hypothetical protein [Lysinibacillus fusiformis]|uniref:hypothetical protein n=1 Tax=Lysinibacillus fusiformis TaxID=28031 RepID=UPI00263B1289|nr:hypothetical protein [Lysinibacillus fusiformis]MDC6266654.1 hypothetical protein [Lysinibacillus sphaericus]MDN4970529.1 hypothetical protein [Lysinibacillus fusiformis]